jgi:hypothetical protein
LQAPNVISVLLWPLLSALPGSGVGSGGIAAEYF